MTPDEMYYQTGKDTVLYQSALHREFSDRAFNLFNLGVAALVAVGVVINFRIEELEWTYPLVGLGAVAILAFILVAALCLSVLRTGDWHSFPPLREVADRVETIRVDYEHLNPQQAGGMLQSTVGDYFTEAADANQMVLDGKQRALFWAVLALAVEILATIALVVLIFWGSRTTPFGEAPTLLV